MYQFIQSLHIHYKEFHIQIQGAIFLHFKYSISYDLNPFKDFKLHNIILLKENFSKLYDNNSRVIIQLHFE